MRLKKDNMDYYKASEWGERRKKAGKGEGGRIFEHDMKAQERMANPALP